LGGQVDDDLDALEGGLDGVEITDVGAMAGHAGHGATVQRAEVVRGPERSAKRGADQPAHTGHEDLHRAVSYHGATQRHIERGPRREAPCSSRKVLRICCRWWAVSWAPRNG